MAVVVAVVGGALLQARDFDRFQTVLGGAACLLLADDRVLRVKAATRIDRLPEAVHRSDLACHGARKMRAKKLRLRNRTGVRRSHGRLPRFSRRNAKAQRSSTHSFPNATCS